MAKANQADLEMAMELTSSLDVLTGWWPIVPLAIEQVGDLEESEHFDRDDAEQCQRVLGYLLDLADKASLLRVTFGCAVMLDPTNELVDPESDSIDHHPKRQQRDELLEVLKSIVGEIDGPNKPFSADSYLPPHLVEKARATIAKTGGAA
ncbi:hypothetical protein OYT1_ch1622 [Ferriphaselus amnicola]|uniref:Uncharacterized protein n=1 Tax=Ferriphaselus amnicola TaxID=1188319 RepID=A0A2Z6GCX1_9PROT|nr:hypothetical protein [Ferriphaselus amnicola]BBE51169.1 hypothetical protein OYT1_ch1622 [Ferriphaselus amnicola]